MPPTQTQGVPPHPALPLGAGNPLLADPGPLGLPDFAAITPAHFGPAFAQGMAAHRAELAAISANPAAPDFDNTAAAFDRSGSALHRAQSVFHNLAASASTPEIQALQREHSGPLAAHWSAVHQDTALFQRLDAVRGQAGNLQPEQQRLLDRLHADFSRAGCQLAPAARAEFAQLQAELAVLATRFAQNLLHDEATRWITLPDAAALAGLPEFVCAAARQAGAERGLDVPVIPLIRSALMPFLAFSTRRDLRQAAWQAWNSRGAHAGAHDNRPLARQILRLRQQQARLLGHASYAEFKLADTMAGRPAAVWQLLDTVWQRALQAQQREEALLRRAMAEAGCDDPLEPWDWRFWAERVRQQHFAIDDAELKPYLALPQMAQAAFDCASRLWGLRFTPRPALQGYHPEVQVWQVDEADGRPIGLFLQDFHARAGKRSGAWMSSLAGQHRNGLAGEAGLPVVLNNCNFARAEGDAPTLLSPDDVRTLFHEFGHALHGLLSDVRYRRLAGTHVLRDFVELPSQLFEHWGEDRGVLQQHARHWQTGAPMPAELLDRLQAARRFGLAADTLRYTASAICDLAVHEQAEGVDDIEAFEAGLMAARGLPAAVGLMHRLPHFQHLFAGDGYAAGYYVYLWAEVLEADAWSAFEEAGDAFDATLAQRLRTQILSRGDSVEPGAAYRAFRGRDARIEPLLRSRGLLA